jgi:hypothetical protein
LIVSNGRAEIAKILTEHDLRRCRRDRGDVDLAATDDDARFLETAVPECRLDERRDAAANRVRIRRHEAPRAGDRHSVFAEPLARAVGELERVHLAEHRGVAARLDPGGERELVEELGHLHRGLPDDLHVAIGRRLELHRPLERLYESVDGRERGPNVVARQRNELGKGRIDRHQL